MDSPNLNDPADLILEDVDESSMDVGSTARSGVPVPRAPVPRANGRSGSLTSNPRSDADRSISFNLRASRKSRRSTPTQSTALPKASHVWTDKLPGVLPCEPDKDQSHIEASGKDVQQSASRHRDLENTNLERGNTKKKMPRMVTAKTGESRISKVTLSRGQHLKEQKPVFADAAEMKKKLREAILKPKYSVFDYYKKDGFFQYIARHNYFEALTLLIIAANAIWMAIDADYNDADLLNDAAGVFQVAEHFFCFYFLVEWVIRFMAFELKADSFKDSWFVFDSGLLILTVAETWVITALMRIMAKDEQSSLLPTPLLRLLRLLRLMRMARMAKLLKTMPELMILIKGMSMATRSVLFTCSLLIILIYVFAIAFTGLLRNTAVGDNHFTDVVTSMITLGLYGTLLDEITFIAYEIGQESMLCSILLGIFILLAALTVMNMLIGVLCEVVNAVAAVERDELVVGRLYDQLKTLFDQQGLDMNGDGQISRSEFEKILEIPQAARALQDVGVDVVGLVDFAEVIFEGDPISGDDEPERQLSFPAFMEVVLQLRGGNTATVKDVVDCRKSIMNHNERLVDNLYACLVDTEHIQIEGGESSPQCGRSDGLRSLKVNNLNTSGKIASFRQTEMPEEIKVQGRASSASTLEKAILPASAPNFKDADSRPTSAITLNIPQEHEDTGGTKDLRTVEDLLTNGLQEIQRIQSKSLSLEESLSAGLTELRAVRRRTEGLQDVFVRGLNEIRRSQ